MSAEVPTLDSGRITPMLSRWATEWRGPGAEVEDVGPMPGNAGLSFGFTVRDPAGSATAPGRSRFVIRLAPPGVRRRGSTDVLRQVPLLGALDRSGVPVAPVRWWTDDPHWFGTDAVVQDFLPGRPLTMVGEPGEAPLPDDDPRLRNAVRAVAAVHALDWEGALAGWAQPRSIADEVATWDRLLEKAPDPDWTAQGRRLAQALVAADPGAHRVGVFHGDFHPQNLLFDDAGSVLAVIDWEIAGVGAVGLDLGWLSMMTDPGCWHEERRAMLRTRSDPGQLLAWYEEAAGQPLPAFDFYRALACYRYGVIAAHNFRLHLTGRRVDAVSARAGRGVPTLFARALELLSD